MRSRTATHDDAVRNSKSRLLANLSLMFIIIFIIIAVVVMIFINFSQLVNVVNEFL